MQRFIKKPTLITISVLICGLASLVTFAFLLGGGLYAFAGMLILAGLTATEVTVRLHRHSLKENAVELAHSIDGLMISDQSVAPLSTAEPLLEPVSASLNRFTQRSADEANLQLKLLERYRSLIDSMADGLITVSDNGLIESVNATGLSLLGQETDGLTTAHLSSFISEPAAVSAKSFLESFIKYSPNDAANSSADMLRFDGSSFPARLSVSKLSESDTDLYIVVFSDISDIRSMERKLRSVNLELSRSNERLEKTSITDSLTRLYNRRHFDSMFLKELQRATRSRTSLSLIVIDIDFFKQYNDIYGHPAGDDCLQKVASSIKKVFKRSGDLPSRYGGEEFAIILPGCDGLELQERAETMRLAVCALEIPHSGSKADSNLSISIGAVTFKPASMEMHAPKPKELFSEADKALYRAKARGRNQVVFAGQYQPMQVPSGLGGIYGQLLSR